MSNQNRNILRPKITSNAKKSFKGNRLLAVLLAAGLALPASCLFESLSRKSNI